MDRKRSLFASASVALLLCRSLAIADDTPRQQAERLAEAAFAERRKGDQMETGWAEAYDHGAELANQAIALAPDFADAYYARFVNLGRKSERTGVAAQAMGVSQLKRLLAKTIELDPHHADAWEAKGEMLIRLPRLLGGSQKEGEQALRRAAELKPKWAKPLLRLAEVDLKNGRTTEARAQAERAAELARAAGDQEFAKEAQDFLKTLPVTGP